MARRIFTGQFQWLKALPLAVLTGLLGILAIMTLAGAQAPDARAREVLFDYFTRIAPVSSAASDDYHLLLIDQASIDAIGPWPWPRTILGELVEKAGAAGAKAVVLAEPVDSPDPLSPETIGDFWLSGASDEALANQLALLPRTDERLAASFAGVAGAIAVADTPPAILKSERADTRGADWLALENSESDFLALPGARYRYRLNESLGDAARASVAALPADRDGVVRRAPLLWAIGSAPAPSLSLEIARLATDNPTVRAFVADTAVTSQGRPVTAIALGDATTTLHNGAVMRLALPKSLVLPSTSAERLLRGTGSNAQLRGKTIIIGLDGTTGAAIRTARGALTPAALHAFAASQISDGATPLRPAWTGYIEALAVMLFGAAAIMTAQRLHFWKAVGFAAAISLVLALMSFGAYGLGQLLINPIPASAALFIGALSVAGGKSIGGALRDDSVRGSFHDTLPDPAIKKLRESDASEVLDGVRREISVLACELRLAREDLQQLENLPDDVTRLIAAASFDLRQTIIASGGVADQAEGGRIFAYYGAPLNSADHAQAACAAALRLIESMDKINEDLEASSRTRGVQMHLAIGMATGSCFAGPMGHGRNNRYSAIGDAVDRAAYLRSQSEFYGPAMICDEALYRETHHHFAFLELDKLKGRNDARAFSIYALIGNPFIKSSKGFRELDDAHRAFLKAYRTGDIATARTMLDRSKQSPGAKIALFDIYERRLAALEKTGAPEGWSGVADIKL